MRTWITGTAAAALLALGAGGAAAQPGAQVQAAFEAARRVSPVPLSLDREQADWLQYGDQGAEGVTERIDELTARAAHDRAAWDLRVTPAELAGSCLPIVLNDCHNVAGGYVTLPDRPTLYWQVQRGFTERDGAMGGFVLLRPDAGGTTLRPVAWDFGGMAYQPPEWIEGASGAVFAAVPGRHAGTGAYNADVIFRLAADEGERPLVQIDNFSWRDTLKDRLPQGLEVWKGVRFIYGALMADTALWRADDANCCPTGGDALLDFEITDDRLVLTGVQVNDASGAVAE